MKRLIPLASLVLVGTVHAFGAGSYVASKDDKTVADMVTRWASQDGRVVKWEAGYDLPIRDAERVTAEAHLERAKTLDAAVERLGTLLADVFPEMPPLAPCVYGEGKVYMVIRTVDQSCEKSAH
ncbi:hypothetical protein [Ralstonia pseudosolanacearum]|uniref:hypothetical protein n=1 Tax=Ralstonia pseudosolanacearum TaxID=1310165 RepID=UPI003CF44B09